jgi:hypothetical protein
VPIASSDEVTPAMAVKLNQRACDHANALIEGGNFTAFDRAFPPSEGPHPLEMN